MFLQTLMQHAICGTSAATSNSWSAILFCSTSLPQVSTRFVRSAIKLCTVHSLSSTLSISLSNNEYFLEHRESNPGPLGEKHKRYLCAVQPPLERYSFNVRVQEQSKLRGKNSILQKYFMPQMIQSWIPSIVTGCFGSCYCFHPIRKFKF